MANKVWWILYIVLRVGTYIWSAEQNSIYTHNLHLIICYNFNFINQLKKSVSDFAITDARCLSVSRVYADCDFKESIVARTLSGIRCVNAAIILYSKHVRHTSSQTYIYAAASHQIYCDAFTEHNICSAMEKNVSFLARDDGWMMKLSTIYYNELYYCCE